MNTIIPAFCTDESQIKTLRNINAVLMFVIMGLVCRFKAPGSLKLRLQASAQVHFKV